ncbi:MAG: hypothetical protein EPN17_07830 [Methylobacter sp.]|nr:MAG: hypothetical protein EPN17_07830 [Methylobacter sp.]
MNRFILTIVCALWWAISSATPTAEPVRAEIEALLAKLQASGCQFNRNGSWYTGAEAKDHLLRKLEYIEDKGTVQSTEQFVELAASKSGLSGKPYQVKCGSESPVESQLWLSKQLSVLRPLSSRSKP